jgi:hypothetical protein
MKPQEAQGPYRTLPSHGVSDAYRYGWVACLASHRFRDKWNVSMFFKLAIVLTGELKLVWH